MNLLFHSFSVSRIVQRSKEIIFDESRACAEMIGHHPGAATSGIIADVDVFVDSTGVWLIFMFVNFLDKILSDDVPGWVI